MYVCVYNDDRAVVLPPARNFVGFFIFLLLFVSFRHAKAVSSTVLARPSFTHTRHT